MKQFRVGITANSGITDVNATLWSNGINQNIVFLGMLLERLDCVSQTAIVNSPNAPAPNLIGQYLGIPTIPESEVSGALDVVIELGVRGDADVFSKFRRGGGKVVSYMAGNTVIMNFECLACHVPHGELISLSGFDACWITPQHWHTNASYARITRTPNTVKAPHIWHPRCFLEEAARSQTNPFIKPIPPDRGWRIGIFDPNVNVVKTFHIPFMVVEQAFRANPSPIANLLLFNTSHIASNGHVNDVLTSADIFAAKKVFSEARYAVASMLGRHIDLVVTHQWENNLNYLYWDVLYSGHPLVHNSEVIQDIGYYYPAFEPVAGGAVLQRAMAEHEGRPQERRRAELDFLYGLSPDNPAVQAEYRKLLNGLYG